MFAEGRQALRGDPLVCTATAQAAAMRFVGSSATMGHQAAPHVTITSLPTDVLGCIVQHIQQDAWQRDQKLDDVAALRGVCRFLRHAVDLVLMHATIHINVGVAELRSVVRRCRGAYECTG